MIVDSKDFSICDVKYKGQKISCSGKLTITGRFAEFDNDQLKDCLLKKMIPPEDYLGYVSDWQAELEIRNDNNNKKNVIREFAGGIAKKEAIAIEFTVIECPWLVFAGSAYVVEVSNTYVKLIGTGALEFDFSEDIQKMLDKPITD